MTHSPTGSCCSRPVQKISTCPVKIRVNLKAEVESYHHLLEVKEVIVSIMP